MKYWLIGFIMGNAFCFIVVYYTTHKEQRDALFSRFTKKGSDVIPPAQ